MIRTEIVLLVLLAVLVSGCASKGAAVEDRYYSLVLAGGASVQSAADPTQPQLVIGPIQLPSYLQGRALSMQKGANRIESAHHHFWAEPLDEAIEKVLVGEIGARVEGISVEHDAGRWTAEPTCRIRIEFDALHPTDRATTETRGRFWLISTTQSNRVEFDISKRLTDDGYGHAVDKLRESLEALSLSIAQVVRDKDACSDDSSTD